MRFCVITDTCLNACASRKCNPRTAQGRGSTSELWRRLCSIVGHSQRQRRGYPGSSWKFPAGASQARDCGKCSLTIITPVDRSGFGNSCIGVSPAWPPGFCLPVINTRGAALDASNDLGCIETGPDQTHCQRSGRGSWRGATAGRICVQEPTRLEPSHGLELKTLKARKTQRHNQIMRAWLGVPAWPIEVRKYPNCANDACARGARARARARATYTRIISTIGAPFLPR